MDNRLNCFAMLCHRRFVVLDTETNGLDTTAEIVEISIIDDQGYVLLDTLVRPVCPIPETATAIHGITNEMVANAPTWPEVYPKVLEVLRGELCVIYNAQFDLRLVLQSCERHGLEVPDKFGAEGFFCAMLEYSHWISEYDVMYRGNRYISLNSAMIRENLVSQNTAHRSLADCAMTLGVVRSVMKKIMTIGTRGQF